MKMKIGFLSLIMLASTIIVNAQGGGGGMRSTPEERSKRAVDTLTTVFKLDQNQQTQTTSAFMDYNKAMDKLRETAQAGTRPDRSEYEKLATDRDEKLKKVLSEEQFKKFKDDIEPAMRPRRQGGGNN